ncbi:TolC family outer membrane protein [Parendozoicomonas haliclonae]|uniref:Outer membrane efflux protein BepC n=1 Tax=Parendozoicomonas haliclonae TaxID=1960125 RepID=A0A1X7APL4_9GAMM|nr:TolC family outer membrane protein [Parendozoicomonas haliclonae]SMA50040.1 Outer membrane efflux protein BepC precursor [Parendozoicomonas haliclonae]
MFKKSLKVSLLAAITASSASTAYAGTLLDSVNEALSTNPEILIRSSEVDARRFEVRGAKAGYLPSVDLRAGIGYENSRNSTTIGFYNAGEESDQDLNRTRRDASIVARQMLWDGSAVESEVDRQKARLSSAAQDLCTAAETVALSATEAYLNILRQQAFVDLTRENVDEHERLVELIRKQGAKGRSNDADIAQAESRMVLAQANLISAESVLRDVRTQYQRIVGNLPQSLTLPSAPAGAPISLDAALAQAIDNHPVLKLAAADIQAAEAQYEASKSSFLPRFELEVGADWNSDANGGKDDTYTHTAKVNMTYNLYSGGADSARKSQTSRLINEAVEVRNRALRQVEEEVRFAWIAVEYGEKRLRPLAEHVKQADLSRELYNKQFMIGNRTLLDLLDSQNEYFSARQSELNARFDLLFNNYRLLQSTGSLLTSVGASLPVENRCGATVAQM